MMFAFLAQGLHFLLKQTEANMVKNSEILQKMYLCAQSFCEKVHLTFMVMAEEQNVVKSQISYLSHAAIIVHN